MLLNDFGLISWPCKDGEHFVLGGGTTRLTSKVAATGNRRLSFGDDYASYHVGIGVCHDDYQFPLINGIRHSLSCNGLVGESLLAFAYPPNDVSRSVSTGDVPESVIDFDSSIEDG